MNISLMHGNNVKLNVVIVFFLKIVNYEKSEQQQNFNSNTFQYGLECCEITYMGVPI